MATRLVGNKSIGTKADSGITQKTTQTASPDLKAVLGPLPYAALRRAYNQTSRIPITKLAGMNADQPVGVFPSARNAAVQASSRYTRWPPYSNDAAVQASSRYTRWPPYSNALTMRPAAKPPPSTRHLLIGSATELGFVVIYVPKCITSGQYNRRAHLPCAAFLRDRFTPRSWCLDSF